MDILIVEDDHLQHTPIYNSLVQAFPGAKVKQISTESGFRSFFDADEGELPKLVVLDVMLRWANPSEDMPVPPQEVIDEGYYRAGFRCEKILAQQEKTKAIPVILYTGLNRDVLKNDLKNVRPKRTEYLRKEPDHEELIQLIRKLIGQL